MNFWTEQRIDMLKRLWGEGLSGGQIAVAIGDFCTRNAVIGKANRLKLEARPTPIKRNKVPAPKQRLKRRSAKAVILGAMAHQSPSPRWAPSDDKPSPFPTCQFPRGDKEAGWDFCGAKPVRGRPYCEECCARAYRHSAKAEESIAWKTKSVGLTLINELAEEVA